MQTRRILNQPTLAQQVLLALGFAAFALATPVTAASAKTTKPKAQATAAPTAAAPAAARLDLQKGDNTVEFLAVGRPGALKIHGQTVKSGDVKEPLKGVLSVSGTGEVTGTATYALDALDTGIEMRTHHMKEKYLQTSKYPLATLKMTKFTLGPEYNSSSYSKEGIPFEGELTLHGVTKPVKGTASAARSDGNFKMTFEFPVQLTDYGIDIPSFAGITVAKDVTATVKLDTPVLGGSKATR